MDVAKEKPLPLDTQRASMAPRLPASLPSCDQKLPMDGDYPNHPEGFYALCAEFENNALVNNKCCIITVITTIYVALSSPHSSLCLPDRAPFRPGTRRNKGEAHGGSHTPLFVTERPLSSRVVVNASGQYTFYLKTDSMWTRYISAVWTRPSPVPQDKQIRDSLSPHKYSPPFPAWYKKIISYFLLYYEKSPRSI